MVRHVLLEAIGARGNGPIDLLKEQIEYFQLEALRRGIWGTKDLWGRVVTFKDEGPEQLHPREVA